MVPPKPVYAAENGLSVIVTEQGKIFLSVDGVTAASNNPGIVQVEKPAGATVRSAYMAATNTFGNTFPRNGAVLIDGQEVTWDATKNVLGSFGFFRNVWADVTNLVKPKIDAAPAGRIDFEISEIDSIEGEVLAVIFDDPNQTSKNTVFLLFGAAHSEGDSFKIHTPPLDTSNPTLKIDMGLGISFSYNPDGSQYSTVDINGIRMTSAAGHYDDGGLTTGLLTVGGLDDSNSNPDDPYANIIDDELYTLLPFVSNGDTEIVVNTRNPSNDDNIFFSYFFLTTLASTEPDTTGPQVTDSVPATGATLMAGPSEIEIEFSEDVKNDASDGAANNPDNYLLVEAGANGEFDTNSCSDPGGGNAAEDDIKQVISNASYSSEDYTATLSLGSPLPGGLYLLFVCGTTSIKDLAGNTLNDGESDTEIDFSVNPAPTLLVSDSVPANGATLISRPSTISVQFNQDVKHDGGDGAANNTNNYLLVEAGSNGEFDTNSCSDPGGGDATEDDIKQLISDASYSSEDFTATLTLDYPLPGGLYRLFVCGTTSIEGLAGNVLNDGESDTEIDFTVYIPNTIRVTTSEPANGATLLNGPRVIHVTFNENVKSDGSDGAANNVNNYLLVEAGLNGAFDTKSCADPGGGRAATDDVKKIITNATYSSDELKATLSLASTLPGGKYRLFVCGTTSIQNLEGISLNDGERDTLIDFTVNRVDSLPATGFAPDYNKALPIQTTEQLYSDTRIWMVIPKLDIQMEIQGVPIVNGTWDVTWLGSNAGWLQGSAFPTYAGNTVLTAHVWDALNKPGPFYNLKQLQYGDLIHIHAWGSVYSYSVRDNYTTTPTNITPMNRKIQDWVTLLTCEGFDVDENGYTHRRVVEAILVDSTILNK
jgi:LPXTG-site transpeptidase (sortase) family protein